MKRPKKEVTHMLTSTKWADPVAKELRELPAGNKKPFLMVRVEGVPFAAEWMQKFFGKIHVTNLSAAGEFFRGTLTPVPEEVWDEKLVVPQKYLFETVNKEGKPSSYEDITLEDAKRIIKRERT